MSRRATMSNQEVEATWKYHEGTKHPDGDLMNPAHDYQPGLEPFKFKVYQGTERITLPLKLEPLGMPALEAIAADIGSLAMERIPSLETLSQILFYSSGV